MIRVVIDTNVLISSLLASGTPKAVLNLAFNQKFAWYVSEAILAEYETVLAYPRLKLHAIEIKRTMAATREVARMVSPRFVLTAASDPADNQFLECAQAAKANYLVTGNLKHFPKLWKYTKIVPANEFLRLWQFQKPLARK